MADSKQADDRWHPNKDFASWAYARLVEAEIEKVESKLRYTLDDVVRLGRVHFSNLLEARLAVALAGTITRYLFEPVPADEFDAFVADRIRRNRKAPHGRINVMMLPKQIVGAAATDMLIVALFEDMKARQDVVEKIAIHCVPQGGEVTKVQPEAAARRKADVAALEQQGCKVFRFFEHEIVSDPLDCARQVNRYLSKLETGYARTFNYPAAVKAPDTA
jgi:hypothetical protein